MKKTAKNHILTSDEAIVSKSLYKASKFWDITHKELGEICGLSEPTISRLGNSKYTLEQNSKAWQVAIIFLRIFRGLDSYMGGHVENEKAWLNAENTALGGKPLELMKNIEGLTNVAQYIDYVRGQYS